MQVERFINVIKSIQLLPWIVSSLNFIPLFINKGDYQLDAATNTPKKVQHYFLFDYFMLTTDLIWACYGSLHTTPGKPPPVEPGVFIVVNSLVFDPTP